MSNGDSGKTMSPRAPDETGPWDPALAILREWDPAWAEACIGSP